MRFEVFKRDKFTCQYCGRMAPDVILEVDHIKPVAEGGKNDLLNLVTSCMECNRGKGRRELSDDTAIKKQQEQLKDLAKKNEQLEMMVRWKDELIALDDRKVDIVCDHIVNNAVGCIHVTLEGKRKIRAWLKDYSIGELIDAVDTAFTREPQNSEKAFNLIPRCAYYARNPMSEEMRQVFYLRKILINRLTYVDEKKAYWYLDKALNKNGIPFEDLKYLCSTCYNWTNFKELIEECLNDETY